MAEHRLVPVERGFRGAEVAVVVGDVAGLAGHPRHGQVVAVVGGDGPDHVPQQQPADDRHVGDPGGGADPPEASPRPVDAVAGSTVQQCQRRDRDQHAQHAEAHHGRFERGRPGDEAGVDVDPCAQPGLGDDLEVGVDAGDLWLLLDGRGARRAGNPDEVGADAARVGPDVQRAAGTRVDRGARCDGGDGIAEGDEDGVGGGPGEQPVTGGVDTAGRNRGEHQTTGRRQGGHGLARDGDIEGQWRTGDQRCRQIADESVGGGRLRPGDGGGGLLDRK